MNPQVTKYFDQLDKWQAELEALRAILLDCLLDEELKWRVPCYSFEGGNVAIIGGLKECCTLSFFKGVLLKDTDGILEKPGDNTQSARVIKFKSVQQIADLEPVLKAYIHEAIEVEKAGLKVEFKKSHEHELPDEFQKQLDENPALQNAFEALTAGRQRAYLLHFAAPKQAKTRESRVEKCIPRILAGKGLNDW